jgi:hypothetical protein
VKEAQVKELENLINIGFGAGNKGVFALMSQIQPISQVGWVLFGSFR